MQQALDGWSYRVSLIGSSIDIYGSERETRTYCNQWCNTA